VPSTSDLPGGDLANLVTAPGRPVSTSNAGLTHDNNCPNRRRPWRPCRNTLQSSADYRDPEMPMLDDSQAATPHDDRERWLTPGVGGVGAASFFSDAGHEMATSLLPTFLTSTLHAGPAALGAIEGVSDALIGVSKLAGGPLSNDPRPGSPEGFVDPPATRC
jgi:hypothetical protein